VYETAARDDDELLGKLKQAGMQVNDVDKDAFVAASKSIYDEFGKEVPGAKELIDRATALRQ
jgi:TRAP-type C4-dicarboxylate transport system substrate-binding protein